MCKIKYRELEGLNRPFCFSYPQELEELKRSILDYGQISPLVLACVNNKLTLVSGYRRFEILVKNQIEPVVCTLKDLSIEQALSLYIVENTFTRRFNPIEKIRISHFIKSSNIRLPLQLINRAGLGDVALAASLSTFDARLPEDLRAFIANKNITINTLIRLTKFSNNTGIEILKLLKCFGLSHSEINKTVLDLYILYMRGEDIEYFIKDAGQLSMAQFRDIILSKLNPELLRIKGEFDRYRATFRYLEILPPENFEGDKYKLTFLLEDEAEIDLFIKELVHLKKIWRENPILK